MNALLEFGLVPVPVPAGAGVLELVPPFQAHLVVYDANPLPAMHPGRGLRICVLAVFMKA